MGNSQSTDIEQLKKLYSMNHLQLEALRNELNQQKVINQQQSRYYQSVISNLQQKQEGLKGRIPENQFDKVEDFLQNMDRDIQSHTANVQSWKPGDSVESSRQSRQPTEPSTITHKNYDDIKTARNEIDPYKLYGFTKGHQFSLQDLKDKYKKYALQTHPDVNGGNDTNFNIVSNAYKFLLEELSKMEKDKQYNELRTDSLSYLESQSKSGVQNRQLDMSKQNFNINQFNKVFQDNRLEDTSQEGYNNWLKDNQYNSDDIARDNSLTSGNFHDRFNHNVKPSKELQKYRLPQELNSRTTNVQELGVDKIDNYSGESGTGNNSIRYTDLKEAHTTSRLVDPNTKYNSYKNIGEVEHARANMGDMTQQDRDMIEHMESTQKRQYQQREENQRRMDRMFSEHHSKMNNIFLGGR